MLRKVQYDKERQSQYDKKFVILSDSEKSTLLVILSVSEISKEFKIRFEFKAKYPRFKCVNPRFEFMDTSLRSV